MKKNTKKVKLADVLWEAANDRLSPRNSWNPAKGVDYYTCNAVRLACARIGADRIGALNFIGELGCPIYSSSAFIQFTEGPVRQGVRYMWLLLAMHVAEDEGIEIEVAA